jgi:hypothetical protein
MQVRSTLEGWQVRERLLRLAQELQMLFST